MAEGPTPTISPIPGCCTLHWRSFGGRRNERTPAPPPTTSIPSSFWFRGGENAMVNAFWVSVRNNISKSWNTTENDVSKNQSSADSAIRLPNTSILNSNAADITEYFLDVPN
ncbi:hypothetical protein TNCV_7361 [Trichonephila clavipes]|nr:hypothetical protein TNCV_7361 [Trichonephila clavipes]